MQSAHIALDAPATIAGHVFLLAKSVLYTNSVKSAPKYPGRDINAILLAINAICDFCPINLKINPESIINGVCIVINIIPIITKVRWKINWISCVSPLANAREINPKNI